MRVARDVHDVLETTRQVQRRVVKTATRRIDEEGRETVIVEGYALQANKFAGSSDGLADLIAGQSRQGDVVDAVGLEVVLRGLDRRLADLGGEHAPEQRRQRDGEVAVAAIQLE